MIKREGKILKYALVRNHLQILSDPRKSFKEQMQSLCFQKPFKTQVTKHDCSEKIWIQAILFFNYSRYCGRHLEVHRFRWSLE
jgi:hypothetical protein